MSRVVVSTVTLGLLSASLLISLTVNIVYGVQLGLHKRRVYRNADNAQFPIKVPEAAMKTAPSLHYPLLPIGNHNWSTLTPPMSAGFIYHPDDQKFYSVALYHQLHCLNSLRKHIARGSDLRLDDEVVTHANHCLDYLRQALLCHSDTTLEPVHNIMVPADPTKNTSEHVDQVSQGWDVLHRCRDWTAVRRYMEENWNDWPSDYRHTV